MKYRKIHILFILPIFFLQNSWAQPTITSFSPASGNAGASVTINGTNFSTTAANNTVYFGSVKATVGSASSTQLTVTVPNGAIFRPISVTVSNLTAYSAQPFITTFSNCGDSLSSTSFQAKADQTAGTTVYASAIGDIDGDGKPDLVCANYSSNTVSVFRNTSSGGSISFAAKSDLSTGASTNPIGVSLTDLDGDGKLDIATSNYTSGTASVFRNTSTSGSLSFATVQSFTLSTNPRFCTAGDIDGDGKPELIAVNSGTTTVSVLRNTSTSGSISFAAKSDFSVGSTPYTPYVGDIDGDGKIDVLVANYSSSSFSEIGRAHV